MTDSIIQPAAMHRLSYGLFVLTSADGGRDNGCIINTAIQLTDSPKRIAIAVNKSNFTHDMVVNSGRFNLSVLTVETPFKVFEHFGFQSGRNVDKFADCQTVSRTDNGLLYIPKYSNAVISGSVFNSVDCGTHTLFTADVTQAQVVGTQRSATYEYYFSDIKPKPAVQPKSGKKRWVCKICGYVYEGDELPADFVCPLCNHGASDFELAL